MDAETSSVVSNVLINILKDNTELTKEKINELVDIFLNTSPVLLRQVMDATGTVPGHLI